MTSMSTAVGLIAVIVLFCLIGAAFVPMFGSVATDAQENDIENSSHNASYKAGNDLAQGFLGLTQAETYLLIILLIIVVILLMFVL